MDEGPIRGWFEIATNPIRARSSLRNDDAGRKRVMGEPIIPPKNFSRRRGIHSGYVAFLFRAFRRYGVRVCCIYRRVPRARTKNRSGNEISSLLCILAFSALLQRERWLLSSSCFPLSFSLRRIFTPDISGMTRLALPVFEISHLRGGRMFH